MQIDDATAYLKRTNKDGKSTYNHLVNIIEHILTQQNGKNIKKEQEIINNEFDNIECISKQIKNQNNTNSNTYKDTTTYFNEEETKEIQNHNDKVLTLFGKKPIQVVNTEEEVEEKEETVIDPTKVLDVISNVQLLKSVGIDLGDHEWNLLQYSCIELVKQHGNIINPRLFGKIYGVENNYFIVETELSEYPDLVAEREAAIAAEEKNEEENEENEDEDEKIKKIIPEIDEKMEKPGSGSNKRVYYVCENLYESKWSQLPWLTPDAVKKSRECHSLITGNLNSIVSGRISFPGNENLFLRCMIERIVCSTVISPVNYYKKSEEENADDPFILESNEEFPCINKEDHQALTGWVHSRGHLRLEGRQIKYVKPETDEENKEESEPTPEEAEEMIEILKPISEDKSELFNFDNGNEEDGGDVDLSCWYKHESPNTLSSFLPYQTASLYNKVWPGHITVYEYNSKKIVNIYIGDGVKYINKAYNPAPLLPTQKEFNEFPDVQNPENEEEMIPSEISIIKEQTDPLPPPPADEEPVKEEETPPEAEEAEK